MEQGVVDQGRRGVGDAACRGGGDSLGKAWVEIEQGEDRAARGQSRGAGDRARGN